MEDRSFFLDYDNCYFADISDAVAWGLQNEAKGSPQSYRGVHSRIYKIWPQVEWYRLKSDKLLKQTYPILPIRVEIFTDGGCWGNPGPGGWGAVLRCHNVEKTFSGSEAYTTNNRMEMTAAIEGLTILIHRCKVLMTTDSSYLKDGITQWIAQWKKNGWKTKEKSLVKNIDLWKRLDLLMSRHDLEWAWVKGHAGHWENELADQLAQEAIKAFFSTLGIDTSKEPQRLVNRILGLIMRWQI